MLWGENGEGNDVDQQIHEGGYNHGEEVAIIGTTYTIIDPHAMMIEVLYASIARLTMSWFIFHKTLAIIAVEQPSFVVLFPLFKTILKIDYFSRLLR